MCILFSSITFAITSSSENSKEINTKKSTILWKGDKVTGSHEGIIKIKSGILLFNNKNVVEVNLRLICQVYHVRIFQENINQN